jgi:hypothetical protein
MADSFVKTDAADLPLFDRIGIGAATLTPWQGRASIRPRARPRTFTLRASPSLRPVRAPVSGNRHESGVCSDVQHIAGRGLRHYCGNVVTEPASNQGTR